MDIELRMLTAAEFPAWLERSKSEYESDFLAMGFSAEEARAKADDSFGGVFPLGVPTVDNAVFFLIASRQEPVGYVWVGTDHSSDPNAWWVWDVVVEPEFRGQGLGKQAMLLAEEYARSQGANTLGLSVFGFNEAAQGLYSSIGYETTSVKMQKKLAPTLQ